MITPWKLSSSGCRRYRKHAHSQPTGGMPRVLIVDDERLGTEVRIAVLRSLGFDAAMSNSGLEAVSRADIRTFDVIVLDYDMPCLNGLETARRLRNIGVHAKLVMLSGRIDAPSDDDCQISTFVSKGEGVPSLQSAILKALQAYPQ
jgi:CheY-like chemotaxis protein